MLDRSEVVNYTRVTQQFLTNLLEGVARGLTSRLVRNCCVTRV